MFPVHRLRRTRKTENMRRLVQETRLDVGNLIYPMFVVPGSDKVEAIPSMPGVFRYSVDRLPEQAKEIAELKIPGVLLFGIPESKDPEGSEAHSPAGTVQRAVRAIKHTAPELVVITDVCLCQYTDHGHCGIYEAGQVHNDDTLEILQQVALSHAQAGADMVAPSDMMDGRVAAIRAALDEDHFEDVGIMAYSAKYASAFYGPFREAAGSAPKEGNRQSYQMNPANVEEALREVTLDIEEGADIIMVKPALAYLDVIRRVKETFQMPVAAYNVSGEVSMIKAAAQNGWIDERSAVMEALTGMRRAGADILITYYAKEVARWLSE